MSDQDNIMGGLGVSEDIQNETNNLGWEPFESDAYDITIEAAFLFKSKSGATCFNLRGKTPEGKELFNQQYVTSNTKKGGQNFYLGKDGKKNYLPGFNIANAISLLTIGKNLNALTTVDGVQEVYNEKKGVKMLPQLAGETVTLGIQLQIQDKQVKDAATGEYVNSGETRKVNEIDKVFRTKDKLTTPEIRAGETEPAFFTRWLEKNKGVTQNRATGASASGVTNGAPPPKQATGTGASAETLFANK